MLARIRHRVKSFAVKSCLRLLSDPEIVKRISDFYRRSIDLEGHLQGNIRAQMWKNATRESAEYAEAHMLTAKSCRNRLELFELSLSISKSGGLYLEFGVEDGDSIRFIAKHVKSMVHGFDSFEGLPEAWFDRFEKSSFSTKGQIPDCPANVQLHVGWFDKSLPEFATSHAGKVAFMHVDCDLYSSTKTIFKVLGDRITSGTVIQFDEYFNYPGWKNHEFKAFQEFVAEKGIHYEYLGYDRNCFSVAVQIS